MKAHVYHAPGKSSWDEMEMPQIQQPTDVLVKIIRTTICGTDLHILKGDVPTVSAGRTLGHEGVGVITAKGDGVTNFAVGDRVLISCITSCGQCDYCRRQMYSHCVRGGWILGNRIDGAQAEYVRIPFAETSLYHAPPGVDDDALLMLSDIFPTGFECGVLNGAIKPGDTVAIVGAGPIGLATLITARMYSPSIIAMVDTDEQRLAVGRKFGATHAVNAKSASAIDQLMRLTNGVGFDAAIEAVGIPETFEMCEQIIAPGGHIANIGVHGKPAAFHLEKLWDRNITITTRLVDTSTTPMLLKALISGAIDTKKMVTHTFRLNEIMKAYDTFSHAAREGALKVVLANA